MIKTKLIDARKNKNFSQQKLADALCMTVANYNRRENGQTKISLDQWQKLANTLDVPVDEIYEAEESQVFIFNDQATGNVNSTVNYNIPLSIWETQKKYLEKIEQENQFLKQENDRLKADK